MPEEELTERVALALQLRILMRQALDKELPTYWVRLGMEELLKGTWGRELEKKREVERN